MKRTRPTAILTSALVGLGLVFAGAAPASANESEQWGSFNCGSSQWVTIAVRGSGTSTTKMGASWKVGGVWKYQWWSNTNVATRYALTGYHDVQAAGASAPVLDQAATKLLCQY
jgi:hypothetical protein